MRKLGVLWFAMLVIAACASEAGTGRFLSLGTGGTGGIYYPLGGALASRLSLADSARQYTAEVTGGSVENVNRVASGEMDLGFSIAPTIHQAYQGGPDHPTPLTNLRLVAPLYPNVLHVLVRPRAGINSLRDIRGKRVSVGSAGSGTEQSTRQLLDALGMSYDDVDARFLSFRESADALGDGAIDVAFVSAGYPAAAVLETTTQGVARLLPIPEDVGRVVIERFPFYTMSNIPAGAYPGVDQALPTVATLNWIVGSEQLPAEVARALLNLLKNERAALQQVHNVAERIDLMALFAEQTIPLHEESVRWRDAELGN